MTYVRPFKRVFWAAGIMSVVVALVEVWLIAYMGRLVDLIAPGSEVSFWDDYGWEFIWMGAFLLLLRPIFQVVDVALLNQSIVPNFGTIVRWRAHRHVLRQSVGWFENDFAGRIANRIMQTPPAAGEVAFQVFDAVTFSLAYIIGAAVLLMGADPRLLLPLLIWFVLYVALMRGRFDVLVLRRSVLNARSEVTGRVVDSYTNIHSVKMFAHHDREIEYAREAIENTRAALQREMRLYTIMDVTLVVLNGLLIVSVVGWSLWLWSGGLATAGIVAAAAAMTLRLNSMTAWIMWAATNLFQNIGEVEDGMKTLTPPHQLTDDPVAKPLAVNKAEIEFRDVSFQYGGAAGGVGDINLTIKAGEKLGIVGASGAGKSTLVALLLRLYDPEKGAVLIDGQPISMVTQDSLRKAIGMVTQETAMFNRSARDNITYGRPKATQDELTSAAQKAEAHEFIADLRDNVGRKGYDAHLGERGVKLSGGQRQRIALARAMLKDAPILILDEATSALDSEVEASIQTALDRAMVGKTVVAIAHRLSTISGMDRIIVLEKGRIVEEGNHEDLLERGGTYAKYWNRQSGGFARTQNAAE
ncbi:UNVERIFIED_CONTAM: hypothetical protein GTU68_021719 [Idotea baltica]|nr:hypothetical protein [Idotea baltica]